MPSRVTSLEYQNAGKHQKFLQFPQTQRIASKQVILLSSIIFSNYKTIKYDNLKRDGHVVKFHKTEGGYSNWNDFLFFTIRYAVQTIHYKRIKV